MKNEINTISFQAKKGAEIKSYIEDLAKLRLSVFREFPYLYDGNMEDEMQYLSMYINSPDAFVVLAFDRGQVVGATTAIPMQSVAPELSRPFQDKKCDLANIMYFGESVLLKEYRGHGFYKSFMQKREEYALAKGYTRCVFCCVEREGNHPQAPDHYIGLGPIWSKMGYEYTPDFKCEVSWQEVGKSCADTKTLSFWQKEIT